MGTVIDDKISLIKELFEPLDILTPRERFIFLEYFYFETHVKEIASVFKVSTQRIYDLVHRIKKKMGEGLTVRQYHMHLRRVRTYGDKRGSKRKVAQCYQAAEDLKEEAEDKGVILSRVSTDSILYSD